MWLRPSAVPRDDSTASSEKRRKRSGSKSAVRPRGCGSAARQSRRLGPEQAGPAMTWVRRGESVHTHAAIRTQTHACARAHWAVRSR